MVKAYIPVVIVLVALAAIVGWNMYSGKSNVKEYCARSAGELGFDPTRCSSVPLQGVESAVVEGGQIVGVLPVSGGSTGGSGGAVPSSGGDALPVKDFALTVAEPYSLSWSAYSGTLRFFSAGTNLNDPNAAAIDTVSITSGAGSKTSWNKLRTDTSYIAVLDGGGVYYDTRIDPFTFLTKNYNKALGTYTMVLGDNGNERLTSKDYPNVFVGEKIGTYSLTFSANTSIITGGDNLNYSDAQFGGQGNVDIKITNSGSNTLIKDAVIVPTNDQSNPLEGNEFTAATIQHVSGTDLGLPSNVLSYLTNSVPIKLGNIKGGVSTTDTWTFTVNEANTDPTETMHLYFDDLGGYRTHDVMVNNLGINATDIKFNFIT